MLSLACKFSRLIPTKGGNANHTKVGYRHHCLNITNNNQVQFSCQTEEYIILFLCLYLSLHSTQINTKGGYSQPCLTATITASVRFFTLRRCRISCTYPLTVFSLK